jgi:hypothetical protein
MDVLLLKFLKYDQDTDMYSWKKRQPLSEEQISFNQVKKAAQNATALSPAFFSKVCIADLDVMKLEYEPAIAASEQDTVWIHETFLRQCVPNLAIDELTSVFLHEAAHLLHRVYPEEFDKIWAEDRAWQKTLAYYPEITSNPSWFSEITANLFALKMAGRCTLTAMEKVLEHCCQHEGMLYRRDLFGENDHNLSLNKTFNILQYYWRQREQLREQSLLRMPLSAKRTDAEYHTQESVSQNETGADGKQDYFEFVVTGDNGNDFLVSLLKSHPLVEILPGWLDIQPAASDNKIRQKQVKQFIHDVTKLMKQLLGSANMSVDSYGNFVYEDLPYGAVRANRAALSRTALPITGSISRIYNELKRYGLPPKEQTEAQQKLEKLYNHIRFPSFEQQREEIDTLAVFRKSDRIR